MDNGLPARGGNVAFKGVAVFVAPGSSGPAAVVFSFSRWRRAASELLK
jgi:hypothetical protein